MSSSLSRRRFLQLGALGAGAMLGGRKTIADIVPDSIPIDVHNVLHPVPPYRGVMWMFRESLGEEGQRGFDARAAKSNSAGVPDGEGGSYGSLVDMRKEHIELAARIGVNTLRCGVNHSYLEDRDTPGKCNPDAFTKIERLLDWCQEYKIDCIFDLHGAIGRDYGGDPRLWRQKDLQDRFCNIWRVIAERFEDHPRLLA